MVRNARAKGRARQSGLSSNSSDDEAGVGNEAGGPANAGATPFRDPIPLEELQRYLTKAKAQHGKIHLAGFENKVRVSIRLEDLHVPLDAVIDRRGRGREVFGREALVKNKLASGRTQDLADVEALQRKA